MSALLPARPALRVAPALAPVPTPVPVAAAARDTRLRLGDVLLQQNLITAEQLQLHLAQQRSTGKKLGRVLNARW